MLSSRTTNASSVIVHLFSKVILTLITSSSWDLFESNFNKLLTHKKLKLSVNITQSVLNAPHVDSVVEWCKNYGIEDIDVNNLTEPKILAIGSDKEELTTWLSKLDKHRGTNSKLVLPWIYE